MLRHAKSYLTSASRNAQEGPEQAAVAFDEARHAAEVAGKALYKRATGKDAGKTHAMQKLLPPQGLVPADIDLKHFSRLMGEHTRGAYGYYEELDESEVAFSLAAAKTMIEAARRWPEGEFHPPAGESRAGL